MSVAILIFLPASLFALDCSPLNPVANKTINKNTQGKIEGAATGLLSKLGGASAEIDGVYKEIVQGGTLSGYPEGAKLYLWEKLIYLKCELLNDSKFSDEQKSNEFDKLIDKLPFPPLASCKFPLDTRAASFAPPEVKNSLNKPIKGFKKASFSISGLAQKGETGKAILYAKLAWEQQKLVYGPYSQSSYAGADAYAELLIEYGESAEHGSQLVQLRNTYGSNIGTHGCLAS